MIKSSKFFYPELEIQILTWSQIYFSLCCSTEWTSNQNWHLFLTLYLEVYTLFSKSMPYFCRPHVMSIHKIQPLPWSSFIFFLIKSSSFLYPEIEIQILTWSQIYFSLCCSAEWTPNWNCWRTNWLFKKSTSWRPYLGTLSWNFEFIWWKCFRLFISKKSTVWSTNWSRKSYQGMGPRNCWNVCRWKKEACHPSWTRLWIKGKIILQAGDWLTLVTSTLSGVAGPGQHGPTLSFAMLNFQHILAKATTNFLVQIGNSMLIKELHNEVGSNWKCPNLSKLVQTGSGPNGKWVQTGSGPKPEVGTNRKWVQTRSVQTCPNLSKHGFIFNFWAFKTFIGSQLRLIKVFGKSPYHFQARR